MNHLTEEDLILHYYGEEGVAAEHLQHCERCRAEYAALQRVLNMVDASPVPELGPAYGEAVWQRIEGQINPGKIKWGNNLAWPQAWRWVAAVAALCILVAIAFPRRRPVVPDADPQTGNRVLLVAVGDYLERSQIVLSELANAGGADALDISSEQERAADLISESRLYRQTATHAGEESVANVLDELEGVLLEIAHSPSRLSPERLAELRQRLSTEGILFKIRVLASNVRDREDAATVVPQKTKRSNRG